MSANLRKPSQERGCAGKINLGSSYQKQAERMKTKHGKEFGVYQCPYCMGSHLTTKLDRCDKYKPLLYRTDKP
jgi:hypothetical protein